MRHLAAGGTTQHLATIVTRPHEHMVRNLKAIVRARQESALLRFAIPGAHLEGPWISLEDGPRGAHDSRYIRKPDFEEFQKLQDAAQGLIKKAPRLRFSQRS
jgi:N-acetylglucosamine-6-phosphate deacetylase